MCFEMLCIYNNYDDNYSDKSEASLPIKDS